MPHCLVVRQRKLKHQSPRSYLSSIRIPSLPYTYSFLLMQKQFTPPFLFHISEAYFPEMEEKLIGHSTAHGPRYLPNEILDHFIPYSDYIHSSAASFQRDCSPLTDSDFMGYDSSHLEHGCQHKRPVFLPIFSSYAVPMGCTYVPVIMPFRVHTSNHCLRFSPPLTPPFNPLSPCAPLYYS